MIYGAALGLSLALVLSLTPLMIALARRFSLFDIPNPRKLHNRRVPTLGGLVLFAGFFAASFATALAFRSTALADLAFKLLIGALPLVAISLCDDIKGASVAIRILFQTVGCIAFVLLARPLASISVPGLGSLASKFLVYPLMVLWLMLMANAINFIDGLDGLAAGIGAISAATLSVSALIGNNPVAALLAFAVLGVTAGFLPYNFYPAKIFMGDTGAIFLGYLLGGIALVGAGKNVAFISLLLPIIAFGIPILDTVTSVVRRSFGGKNIFAADRNHIHHRLLTIGITHRRAVLYLYFLSALLGITGISLFYQNRFISLLFFIIGLTVTLILFRR